MWQVMGTFQVYCYSSTYDVLEEYKFKLLKRSSFCWWLLEENSDTTSKHNLGYWALSGGVLAKVDQYNSKKITGKV